jgi:NAD-dependent SIR2 family protein deacetylase
MRARLQPRPQFHALLNILAGLGLVASIISTNVDGLEIMNSDLIPEAFNEHDWSEAKWLSREDDIFIPLHGDIGTASCSTCNHRIHLAEGTISLLIEGNMEQCPTCSHRPRPQKHLWRPDILFYNDPREAKQHENQDQDYVEGTSEIMGKHASWSPTSIFSPLLL